MQLVTYTANNQTRLGALKGGGIVDLQATDAKVPDDMLSLLQGGDDALAAARAAAETGSAAVSLDDAQLECPIANPSKILAVGLNYIQHIMEIPEDVRKARGFKVPETPVIFNKQSTSANGPYADISLPQESVELDYEAELGVVIGKTCRRVGKEDAYRVIAGYTIINDVTIRDWQRATPTMTMGKSWDTHCPMGPSIVTTDEITDPHSLHVRLTLDGDERQNYNTADMHFKIDELIAHLSTAFTLLPGDVIATGTSAGVAAFMDGQPWMQAGQKVRIDIDKIGYIENTVVADSQSYIR